MQLFRFPFSFVFVLFFPALGYSHGPSVSSDLSELRIERVLRKIRSIKSINSFVVVQKGVVKAQYFKEDLGWQSPQDVRSVTKLVTALLIGLAIDNSFFISVDQNVGKFFPAWHRNAKKVPFDGRLNLKFLLSMTSGFDWNEWRDVREYSNWWKAPNQEEFLFHRSLISKPGSKFSYNSATAHLLSIILTHVTGMKTEEFAKKYLFNPGIRFYRWEKDKKGINNGASGLILDAMGMQKLGQLMLKRGKIGEKSVISGSWIDKQTESEIKLEEMNSYADSYGFLTWINNNKSRPFFYAMGYGGQLILVCPKMDLVITATTLWKGLGIQLATQNWDRLMEIVLFLLGLDENNLKN